MSDATITDGTTMITFIGNPDFKPLIHNNGAAYYPLDYPYTVLTVDVARRGGTWTMVAIDPDTGTSSQAADDALWAMLMENVPLTITFPDGSTMVVGLDPATDPVGTAQYSIWLNNYVNTWTVKFFEVDEA